LFSLVFHCGEPEKRNKNYSLKGLGHEKELKYFDENGFIYEHLPVFNFLSEYVGELLQLKFTARLR
jgi:hypothetical protein